MNNIHEVQITYRSPNSITHELILHAIKEGLPLTVLPYTGFVKIHDIVLVGYSNVSCDPNSTRCFNLSTVAISIYVDPRIHTILALEGASFNISRVEQAIGEFCRSTGFMTRLNYARKNL